MAAAGRAFQRHWRVVHSLALLSSDAVSTRVPSGENTAETTLASWRRITRRYPYRWQRPTDERSCQMRRSARAPHRAKTRPNTPGPSWPRKTRSSAPLVRPKAEQSCHRIRSALARHRAKTPPRQLRPRGRAVRVVRLRWWRPTDGRCCQYEAVSTRAPSGENMTEWTGASSWPRKDTQIQRY